MPTHRYTPVRGFPPGRSNLSEHRPEPVFPDGEIWKLSVLLNRPVDDLKSVLQAVEESVRLIDDTEGAPRSSQWAALDEIFSAAERLQMQLAEIDQSSRGRILDEYASEYARQYDVSP